MSSSGSSSAPSPSPPTSPGPVTHDLPTLEQLVVHFVSAKRSLVSISHVWHANELVTSSRALVEEIAVLNAKTAYIRRGVEEQIDTLRAIRDEVAAVDAQAADDFQTTIAGLDKASDRLQDTLQQMRTTIVDASLRRTSTSHPGENDEGEEAGGAAETEKVNAPLEDEKTLYDFIDEANHEDILSSLRELIDSFGAARKDLGHILQAIDHSLDAVTETLRSGADEGEEPPDPANIYDDPPASIPQLFRGMESQAAEMATLLHSLVSHYDLCVTALKHTEGGGAAAKQAIQQAAELSARPPPNAEESLYRQTAAEPISPAERAEMLGVLAGDAREVADVRAELGEHAAALAATHSRLAARAEGARAAHRALRRACARLRGIRAALPRHRAAVRAFRDRWHALRAQVPPRARALADLALFHAQFLAAYARLLQELARRRAVDLQAAKVAARARRDLRRLHDADRDAREAFLDAVGGFLPGDLYPDLAAEGTRWEVRPVGRGPGGDAVGE